MSEALEMLLTGLDEYNAKFNLSIGSIIAGTCAEDITSPASGRERKTNSSINLPGMPDEVRYDGQGYCWIAIAAAKTAYAEPALKYPPIRNVMAMLKKYLATPPRQQRGEYSWWIWKEIRSHTITVINQQSEERTLATCGSVEHPYIVRLDLNQYRAQASA
ncbi:hypothetical protein NL676_014573 [Syzygium grande]|nr:hypothetical protein NL676_014573 [Syzygium grande]